MAEKTPWWKPLQKEALERKKQFKRLNLPRGSFFTGAGPDGEIQPDRPAMFDRATGSIYHEGEAVIPNQVGKEIIPAQTVQDQMRMSQMEQRGVPGFQSGGQAPNLYSFELPTETRTVGSVGGSTPQVTQFNLGSDDQGSDTNKTPSDATDYNTASMEWLRGAMEGDNPYLRTMANRALGSYDAASAANQAATGMRIASNQNLPAGAANALRAMGNRDFAMGRAELGGKIAETAQGQMQNAAVQLGNSSQGRMQLDENARQFDESVRQFDVEQAAQADRDFMNDFTNMLKVDPAEAARMYKEKTGQDVDTKFANEALEQAFEKGELTLDELRKTKRGNARTSTAAYITGKLTDEDFREWATPDEDSGEAGWMTDPSFLNNLSDQFAVDGIRGPDGEFEEFDMDNPSHVAWAQDKVDQYGVDAMTAKVNQMQNAPWYQAAILGDDGKIDPVKKQNLDDSLNIVTGVTELGFWPKFDTSGNILYTDSQGNSLVLPSILNPNPVVTFQNPETGEATSIDLTWTDDGGLKTSDGITYRLNDAGNVEYTNKNGTTGNVENFDGYVYQQIKPLLEAEQQDGGDWDEFGNSTITTVTNETGDEVDLDSITDGKTFDLGGVLYIKDETMPTGRRRIEPKDYTDEDLDSIEVQNIIKNFPDSDVAKELQRRVDESNKLNPIRHTIMPRGR